MVVYLHEALDARIRRGTALTEQDLWEATIAGSVLRLRPKIMTVATTVCSIVPIMAATSVGADIMKPIAAPILGGMITSTIHVLIVTPVIFYLMKLRLLRGGRLEASRMGRYDRSSLAVGGGRWAVGRDWSRRTEEQPAERRCFAPILPVEPARRPPTAPRLPPIHPSPLPLH